MCKNKNCLNSNSNIGSYFNKQTFAKQLSLNIFNDLNRLNERIHKIHGRCHVCYGHNQTWPDSDQSETPRGVAWIKAVTIRYHAVRLGFIELNFLNTNGP